MSVLVCFFFFFQAEVGIRDLTVTGVQTCALPISARRRVRWSGAIPAAGHAAGVLPALGGAPVVVGDREVLHRGPAVARLRVEAHELADLVGQVGVDLQAEGAGVVDVDGKSWVQRPWVRVVATSSARVSSSWWRSSPLTNSCTCDCALRATSARIRVLSSVSLASFWLTAARMEAAAYSPSCGSTGPSTAEGESTMRSAARRGGDQRAGPPRSLTRGSGGERRGGTD